MSKKQRKASSNNNAASKSKNTEIYTPDTAPLVFNDTIKIEDNVEKKEEIIKCADDIIIVDTNKNDTAEKSNTIVETHKTKKEYNLSFLKNKVNCRIIGLPIYRNVSLMSIKDLIQLVLDNSLGLYSVIVSEQCANTISDFIKNATNSELSCELNESQKNDRINKLKSGLKMYSL